MVKNIEYTTRGTCSRQIKVQIEDGIIQSVQFVGGCNGNKTSLKSSKERTAEAAVPPAPTSLQKRSKRP